MPERVTPAVAHIKGHVKLEARTIGCPYETGCAFLLLLQLLW
jgi:hypothetical protein